MGKNKRNNKQVTQQYLSPEQYLKQKARTLEIGKCYTTNALKEVGEGMIIVTRKHTGGRVSMASYLVDAYCLGVKDSFYRFRIEDYEVEELVDQVGAVECSYDEAHNWIYGAIAYAEEAGIKPDKSFALTQYMLEEDSDDIPLIEYEFGKNGKHTLITKSHLEASKYLPQLKKNLGEGNFDYILRINGDVNSEDDAAAHGSGLMMEDLVPDMDKSALIGFSTLMGFHIAKDQDIDDIRREYIKLVLENPIQVLARLPFEECVILGKLRDNPSQAEDGVKVQFNYLLYFLERLGLGEGMWDSMGYYRIKVADDFAQAAIPHLDELMNFPEYMLKSGVEGIVEGMTNLYGEVSLAEVKQQMKATMEIDDQMADEFYDIAIGTSLLLATLLTTLDESKELDETFPDDETFFISRYSWDDDSAQHRAIMLHSSDILEKKHFTTLELTEATSNFIPVFPNKKQKHFTRYLKSLLPYKDKDIQEICFNLWYRAVHEYDEDFQEGSAEDYFLNDVIRVPCGLFPQKRTDEAMRQLKEYMDNIPRWTLKGYSPNEV